MTIKRFFAILYGMGKIMQKTKIPKRNIQAVALHSTIFHLKVVPCRKTKYKGGYVKHRNKVIGSDN